MNTRELIDELGACQEACDWAEDHPEPEAAWRASVRGDHVLWIAGKLGVDRRLLVLAACACARTALVHVPEGEDRPRIAIETAEAWARGEATIEQVRVAGVAAEAAAFDYDGDAADGDAAYAAVDAAWTVDNALVAAGAAGLTGAATAESLANAADIVRGFIPWAAVADKVAEFVAEFVAVGA